MFQWMAPDPRSLPEISHNVDFWWRMGYCRETGYSRCKVLLGYTQIFQLNMRDLSPITTDVTEEHVITD